ncbi:MAG: AraC family transcriptional regulator [Kiritimatiellia bacterium]
MKLRGEYPHLPPSPAEQHRLCTLRPYVREANAIFRPTWSLGPRRLLDYLLVHILDGKGTFCIAGETMQVCPGDLIWIPPGVCHEMAGHAPGNNLQYIHFDLIYDPSRSHWSARTPEGTTDTTPWQDKMHPPLQDPILDSWCGILRRGDPQLVTTQLRRIILTYQQTGVSGLFIASLLQQLICHLIDHDEPQRRSPGHQTTMKHAMQMIQSRNGIQQNLATLARQHGMSPSHFRKCFRDHFDCSPLDAMIQARMHVAMDYLTYSDVSISEIAERLGYSNVHNFSRAFQRHKGISPSACRQRKMNPKMSREPKRTDQTSGRRANA